MARELPYFQFEPAEYLTKDVSFCSLSAQGLFINICSFYWQRQCRLDENQFLKRFNYPTEFEELVNEGIIDVVDGEIIIKFLDNQYDNATERSKINSQNGSKGGRPKKQIKTETKPKLNQNESELKGIREDKKKEEEIIKDKIIKEKKEYAEIYPTFDDFWEEYDKKVGKKEKIKSKWDLLGQTEKEKIMTYIPDYKISQPNKKYRKNPETFLNNESWNDEIIIFSETESKQIQKNNQTIDVFKKNIQGWN